MKRAVMSREGAEHYDYKSMLYTIDRDTFRITLIDKSRNGRFNDLDDLIVISSSVDTVPLLPFMNLNVVNYSDQLLLAYKDHYFEVKHLPENGKSVQLKHIPKSKIDGRKPDAHFTELLNLDHLIENVHTREAESIIEILEDNPKQRVYFHFWWTACVPCFNEIPFLQKLEQEGILVINLASKQYETHADLLKSIAKHDYPGLHYYSTPDVVREFSQNGFPFGVLVESNSGKQLKHGSAFKIFDFIHGR